MPGDILSEKKAKCKRAYILCHSFCIKKEEIRKCTDYLLAFTKINTGVQFSCSFMSNSLRPHGLQRNRPPCPSPTPRVYSNSCPLSWWCHPTISSSVVPFSRLQSLPASGSFQMSQFCASGGQSIGVSASTSVLPMNIEDWFPGLISPQSKGLSRVFSSTTVQKHQFFGAQPSLWSNSHIIHDYWKNHSFDYWDLCWQSDVLHKFIFQVFIEHLLYYERASLVAQ